MKYGKLGGVPNCGEKKFLSERFWSIRIKYVLTEN